MNVKPNRVGEFPFRKSDPEERKKNFSEVQQPYSEIEVMAEAERCLLCGTPVCIDACPVLLDVRGMNEAVARGDFKTAHDRIRETNPLIGVTARCCPQLQGLCEDACVMRWSGQPVGIGLIQRFVADWERKNRQPDPEVSPDTGKKVAIIGSGPSGLAAAELLRRYGHAVTVFEEMDAPGGTAWYGIPDYHLPKDVLKHEIERIKGMGVQISTGVKIGGDKMPLASIQEDYDAVLITTGAKDPTRLKTPGIGLRGVCSGYDFLQTVFGNGLENYLKNPSFDLGKEIIVVGGGDSSLDCARTALRLTGGTVTLTYRRSENDMPADPVMLDEAKEEGVNFRFLVEPKAYEGSDGKLTFAVFDTMQLSEPDESGRRSPEPVAGKEFRIACSTVLLAVGRGPNSLLQKQTGLKMGPRNSIAVNEFFETSMKGVFSAGDVTSGETLVVRAMGSGREAAQRVHEYLMNLRDQHVSFYERYYNQNLYDRMLDGSVSHEIPPD